MSVTSKSYKKELYNEWKKSKYSSFEDYLLSKEAQDLMTAHNKSLYSLLWAVNMIEMEEEYKDISFSILKEHIDSVIDSNNDD